MEVQKEEQVTYYITMDKHDVLATRAMVQFWYDNLPDDRRPTVIEFVILDTFGVEY